jgi:hypothetical protein
MQISFSLSVIGTEGSLGDTGGWHAHVTTRVTNKFAGCI